MVEWARSFWRHRKAVRGKRLEHPDDRRVGLGQQINRNAASLRLFDGDYGFDGGYRFDDAYGVNRHDVDFVFIEHLQPAEFGRIYRSDGDIFRHESLVVAHDGRLIFCLGIDRLDGCEPIRIGRFQHAGIDRVFIDINQRHQCKSVRLGFIDGTDLDVDLVIDQCRRVECEPTRLGIFQLADLDHILDHVKLGDR